jgi:uncharacterized phage-associated protein
MRFSMSGSDVSTSGSLKVARYLVARSAEVTGKLIGHLKLQKLAYYAQGFSLALRDRELFRTPLEAWDRGPVVRDVYRVYRDGSKPIERPADFDAEDYLPETRELLDAILESYGRLSATRLGGMTHSEPPWLEAYQIRRNTPLSLPTMRHFFGDLVELAYQGQTYKDYPAFPIGSLKHQRRRDVGDRMGPHREKLRAIARSQPSPIDSWPDDEF